MLAVHEANAAVAGTNESAFNSNLGYSGEQWDSSLRMQNLRARAYDPANGRFIGLDPFAGNMQDPQSLHKYAYVHGDPVQGIDPTGEMNLSTTIGGISIGTILSTAMKGAIFAGTFGFYAGTADSLLGGKSFKQSIQDGAYTAVFAAAIGGILAPAWLLGIWGAGVVQATALSTAIIGQSGLVGIGIAETIDSIKQGKFTQAAFRGALTLWLGQQGVRGVGAVRLRARPVYDFSSLSNKGIDEILDAIPPDATIENFVPNNYVSDGVKFKFEYNGQTWRVRIHGPDSNPNIPPGSNAAQGWIVRVQKGNQFMDSNGVFHARATVNPNNNSGQFNPQIANDTHIPIRTPSLTGKAMTELAGGATPIITP